MKQSGIIVLIYGLLVLVGGIIGHYKAHSMASLVSGISFGALLLGISWALLKNKLTGMYSALVVAFALDAFFTYRLVISHKFFPSGFMSIISIVVIIALTIYLRKETKKQIASAP